jgi:hypothetical protein
VKGFVAICCCLALAAPALAAEPASKFNAPGQAHANVCASLTGSSAPLRYADATPTGFSVLDSFSFADGRCPAGTVRLDLHELLPSSAGPLAFHRGGNGYANDQNVKYGELAVGALAGALPAPVPSGGGRGAPCAVAPGPAWQVDVRSIPSAMKYKRPQEVPGGNNSGSSFMHYGDPGADQGDRHDIHYSYLVWSFVNVRGGGMVRTLLEQEQVVEPCDVEPVTMTAWDRAGDANGSVTARYVRVYGGSCPLYGWMAWTHSYRGGAPVTHVKAGGAVAPPEPAADCPVAAAAAPPTVATGDAAFTGSVNPQGVPTSYRFEYDGGATAEGSLGSSVRDVAVSALLPEGLAPATTYGYRLVASNAHGTSYGETRTFTTPAPPPVEAVVPPPPPTPPPAPAALRSLRVAPQSFRRGRTARVVWSLTRSATVTLTFERWTGRRWKRVRGALRAAPAARSIRFRGFIGKRRMARATYRLTATPRGGGKPRHARFRLR